VDEKAWGLGKGRFRGEGGLGGNKGSSRAASKDSEEVVGINEGVVEVAVSVFLFNPPVASSLEFLGGVEGESDWGLRENGFGGQKGLEGNAGLSGASGSKGGSKGEEVDEMCEGVVGLARITGVVRLRRFRGENGGGRERGWKKQG
jgi:hypothetical protein